MSAAYSLPGSMRIFERGWLSANNILFIGRDETALVDSGYATHAPQTLALVRHALGERALDRFRDAEVGRHAGLGVEGTVVVAGVPDVRAAVPTRSWSWSTLRGCTGPAPCSASGSTTW